MAGPGFYMEAALLSQTKAGLFAGRARLQTLCGSCDVLTTYNWNISREYTKTCSLNDEGNTKKD